MAVLPVHHLCITSTALGSVARFLAYLYFNLRYMGQGCCWVSMWVHCGMPPRAHNATQCHTWISDGESSYSPQLSLQLYGTSTTEHTCGRPGPGQSPAHYRCGAVTAHVTGAAAAAPIRNLYYILKRLIHGGGRFWGGSISCEVGKI
jgi:hypothetical protein